jgi:hypothetical protein
MKITIKKALATIAMLGVLGGLAFNVNAAAQNSTSSFDGSNTITVTVPGVADFTADVLTTLKVTDQDGTGLTNVDVADVTENANTTFTVNTTDHGALADGIYSVSFITTAGEFGSSIFVVNNANEVTVTANVLPILTMKLTGGAVAFGDLVADTVTTSANTTDIEVDTNAALGYTLQVANSANGLYNGTTAIAAAGTKEDLSSNYGYGINATVDAGATIDSVASATATINATLFDGGTQIASGMSSTPATLTSSTGPVANQTTTVSYHTRISALQETGNYTDTVTYSLSGSF